MVILIRDVFFAFLAMKAGYTDSEENVLLSNRFYFSLPHVLLYILLPGTIYATHTE